MDFNVDVKVRTSGKEEIDVLERQIEALKNETVKINIDVDDKNLNLKNLQNSINKTALSSGQSYGKSFNKGIGQVVSNETRNTLEKVQSKVIGNGFTVSKTMSDKIQGELDSIVKKMTNGKGEISSISLDTKTVFDENTLQNVEKLRSATVKYTNDVGEAVTKTLQWKKIGEDPNAKKGQEAIMGWVESTARYNKSIDEAAKRSDTFTNKQKQVATQLKNQTKQIYRDALDPNATKPIKETSHLDSIKKQYTDIGNAINSLSGLSGNAFSDQENNIKSMITDFKILKKEYRNAETMASSLRSKPIDVQKTELEEKVKGLQSNMKKSGLSPDDKDFKHYFDDINQILSGDDIDNSKIRESLDLYSKLNAKVVSTKKETDANKSLEKVQVQASALKDKINDSVSNNVNLQGFTHEINGAEVSVKSLLSELGEIKTKADVDIVSEKFKAFSNAAKESGVMVDQVASKANKVEQIQKDFFSDAYNAKLSTMTSKLDPYEGQDSDLVKRAREQQELYKDSLSKLNDHFDSEKSFKLNDDEVVTAYNNMTSAAKRFDNIMTQVRNTESKTLGLGVAERSANAVKKYYDENSNAVKKYGLELKDLEKRYREVKTVEDKANLDNEFKNLKSKISAEGLTGKSTIDEIKRGFKQIGQFALTYGVLQKIPDVLARMANEVLDVDTAMTNLYKVTDETTAKYDEFLGNAGNVSRSLGRDMSSYITQTSEWAKLGYSMDKSANLSKISSIYANVGEVDDKTAVSDMVTAMKAFNIEADNAIRVVDSLNALGNNFATSSADLGTGLSNAASSLSTAGNDINQSLAMLTGMTEITQSASESGNALKILSMRLRGYDEETQSYSNDVEELTGKVADLTKTASKPGGISLFSDKDKQTYKSTYKIMEEVSDVWDDLTDKSRAELTEVLAGKNRGNQISALIQSFKSGQVQKAYETSLNSEGSAQQEQDRWMQSMEAKIQQFKSQFQELSTTAMDSDLLKGAIDAGTSLLNVLTQIVDVGGTIPIILGGIGGAKLFKNLDEPINHRVSA